MNKILFIFSFFVLGSLFFLCNTSYSLAFTEEELSMQRLQDRLNSLEKNMATMQQELYKSSKTNKSKQKPSEEPLGADEEKSRTLNGKIEELEHSINTLAAKLDKIIADIDFRLSAIEKKASSSNQATENRPIETANQNASTGNTIAKPEAESTTTPENTNLNQVITPDKPTEKKAATPSVAPKSDAAAQYDKAFEFLRAAKYDDAERSFKDFIANNKGSELLSNAYYWLGETYFTRENYQQAAVSFLKGYQDFPKGNKAPDNLLKLAISLKNLKKEKEACATLDKMRKEYPKMDKDLSTKATAERTALKCK